MRQYCLAMVLLFANLAHARFSCCWCQAKYSEDMSVVAMKDKMDCEKRGAKLMANCKLVNVAGNSCSLVTITPFQGGYACKKTPLEYEDNGKRGIIEPPATTLCDTQGSSVEPSAPRSERAAETPTTTATASASSKGRCTCGRDSIDNTKCTLRRDGSVLATLGFGVKPGGCTAEMCSELFEGTIDQNCNEVEHLTP